MNLGKDAIAATRDMALPKLLDARRSRLALAFTTEDIREGVAAFRERRDPVWRRR
jgi:enoyl-CoA hydratase